MAPSTCGHLGDQRGRATPARTGSSDEPIRSPRAAKPYTRSSRRVRLGLPKSTAAGAAGGLSRDRWRASPVRGYLTWKPPFNGRPPSRQDLRTRVRYHYRGNAYGSTLRLALGCLLGQSLGLRLQTVSLSGRMTFASGEDRLTAWMSEHAYVAWMPYSSPWLLEDRLIEGVSLPLNLRGNQTHAFHPALTDLRRTAREEALRVGPAEA